jgi:hypothetical protein
LPKDPTDQDPNLLITPEQRANLETFQDPGADQPRGSRGSAEITASQGTRAKIGRFATFRHCFPSPARVKACWSLIARADPPLSRNF